MSPCRVAGAGNYLASLVTTESMAETGIAITSRCQSRGIVSLLLLDSYFSLESTQEMLEEWRPLLCPFDMAMIESMNLLSEMLPTTLPPQHHDRGFK